SVAALVATFVAVAPALDNSATAAMLSLVPCVLGWAAVVAVAPKQLRPAGVLPLAAASVAPVAVFLDLAGSAFDATFGVGAPYPQPFGVHVASSSPWVVPWLAAPILVALAAAACALVGLATPVRRTTWVAAVTSAAVAGGLVTLPLYD